MLVVQCVKCKRQFSVKGHTIPDGYWEPGEVVTELECDEPLCQCLQDGELFDVVEETHTYFEDDVL